MSRATTLNQFHPLLTRKSHFSEVQAIHFSVNLAKRYPTTIMRVFLVSYVRYTRRSLCNVLDFVNPKSY